MFWKLAIVEELLTGSDGQVRVAVVKVPYSRKRAFYITLNIFSLINFTNLSLLQYIVEFATLVVAINVGSLRIAFVSGILLTNYF